MRGGSDLLRGARIVGRGSSGCGRPSRQKWSLELGQPQASCIVLVLFYDPFSQNAGLRTPCPRLPSPRLPSPFRAATAPRSSTSCAACCRAWKAPPRRRAPCPSAWRRSTRICRRAASRSAPCTRSRRINMATPRPRPASSSPCSRGLRRRMSRRKPAPHLVREPAPDLIRGGHRFADIGERSDAVLRTAMDMRQSINREHVPIPPE